MMGRREDRAALESTWSTYTPAVPGTPFRKKDIEDATEADNARETFLRWHQARIAIGMSVAEADELSAQDEPSHPVAPALQQGARTAARPDGTLGDMLPRTLMARLSGARR